MEITRGLERDGEAIWLHVEDDGIGMSERTITTSLLDFGKSFWISDAVMQEFSGLIAKGLSATGRFDVGFFSVFVLGGAGVKRNPYKNREWSLFRPAQHASKGTVALRYINKRSFIF